MLNDLRVLTQGSEKEKCQWYAKAVKDFYAINRKPEAFIVEYLMSPATVQWAKECEFDKGVKAIEIGEELGLPPLPRGFICLEEPYKSWLFRS